jgi:hypothetical protein
MPVTISGTTGITGPDGSASTPSLAGADTNTGVFFPAADTVAIATGGSERMRINSSGDVGIGTSSPATRLHVAKAGSNYVVVENTSTSVSTYFGSETSNGIVLTTTNHPLAFGTNNAERARIDTSGNLLVGTTSAFDSAYTMSVQVRNATGGIVIRPGSDNYTAMSFRTAGNTQVGNITVGPSSTSFVTTSDYRLKENVQPMVGALSKIAALKPCTYKWKADGSDGQGFIAHELQEVVPDAVVGDKDAVNEDGSIKAQGIDTSFLVATLTAAIQEQQALITSLTARIAALEGAAP